jgi:hypothetical protein
LFSPHFSLSLYLSLTQKIIISKATAVRVGHDPLNKIKPPSFPFLQIIFENEIFAACPLAQTTNKQAGIHTHRLCLPACPVCVLWWVTNACKIDSRSHHFHAPISYLMSDWLCGRPARVTEHNLKRKILTKGRHPKSKIKSNSQKCRFTTKFALSLSLFRHDQNEKQKSRIQKTK